jgi:amidase
MRRTSLVVVVSITIATLAVGGTAQPAAGGTAPVAIGPKAWLDALTIPQIQARIGRGDLTSHRLTAAYLRRIAALDDDVNSILKLNPRALAEADASDAYREAHGRRSKLEGVPVLLKDNIDTADLGDTAGSRALLGSRPARDAKLVRRLRSAGAVILGKANLTEWANFRDGRATSGWSGVGGQTNNPYVLDRNPCGSSSGSGAAVAAALAQVTIGTETDGSIVCPSGAMGLVGLKPTLGLVSRAGIIPISAQQDTAGPMARHVVDAAITMNVIQGEDPQDPATRAIPPDQPRVYRLDGRALDGARIGVWRMAGIDPDVDAIVERSVQAMRAAGATVVEVTLDESAVFNDEVTAIFSEFKRDIAKYLRVTPGRHPATLAELIAFNQADPIELRFFGQDRFELAERAPLASDPVVVAARQRATSRARAIIDEALAVYDLDAIVAPTNGPAWLTTLGQGDAVTGPSSSRLPAVSGYPSITVPAGLDGELPIGVSFIGTRFADGDLLSLAFSFEHATHARRAPKLLASIGGRGADRRGGLPEEVTGPGNFSPPGRTGRSRPPTSGVSGTPNGEALPCNRYRRCEARDQGTLAARAA